MEKNTAPEKKYKISLNVRLWRNIALVSGIFSFIMCFLIIANYFQLNRLDPVNTELINTLVERLHQNPQDEALRMEIRELDLLARKAYFTNQWQIRAGGYLLLIGLAILVIAFQVIENFKKIYPENPVEDPYDLLKIQKRARKWISISGGLIILITLILAFLTQNQLKETFIRQAELTGQHLISDVQAMDTSGIRMDNTQGFTKQDDMNVAQSDDLKGTDEIEVVEVDSKEPEKEKQLEKTQKSTTIQRFTSFRGEGGLGIATAQDVPLKWDGITGENIKWKVQIPLHGYNSPVIWDNRIFLTGADATTRIVYCFDLETGSLLWSVKADNIPGSPDKVPDVTDDTGHAAPTMTTNGKNVFAIFSNGDLIALDMDGNKKWAKNLGLPQNHYGHSSSLVMFQDLLVVQYDQRGSAKIMAFHAKDGEKAWETSRNVKISWASPVLVNTGNRTEIFLVADPGVASYNARTGEEIWKIDCIYGEVGPSVAYDDGIVFATNEYASLVAIKTGDKPEILWEDYEYLSDVPSPVAIDGLLIVATSYGVVVCYEGNSGTKVWEHEFDNGFYSSPMVVDGNIFLIDKKGIMQVFRATKEFKLLASNPLGENAYATPAFMDGHIIIRGDNNLYCIGKD